MAAYTSITPGTQLVPGKPFTSAIAQALEENPRAIAEGASGAPKVRTAALQPPTAGSTSIRSLRNITTGGFDSSTSPASGLMPEGSVVALVPGTIRVVSTIGTSGTFTAYTVSYKKNGVAFATFSSPTTGLQFVDVAVVTGDRIEIDVTASTGSGGTNSVTLSNVKIESGTSDFAVA